jgi:hypothetical protein
MAKLNPIILLGAGGLALLMMGGKKGSGGGGVPDPLEIDPDLPGVEDPPPEPAPTTAPRKRVPSKTGATPYNKEMFGSIGDVRAYLGSLSPTRYVGVTHPSTQVFHSAVKLFQQDWNTLASQGKLSYPALNKSHLATDGIPGPQTLRAIEWGRTLSWASKVLNF